MQPKEVFDTTNFANETKDKMQSILSEFENITTNIEHPTDGVNAVIVNSKAAYQTVLKEIDNDNAVINILKALSKIRDAHIKFEKNLSEGNLKLATNSLCLEDEELSKFPHLEQQPTIITKIKERLSYGKLTIGSILKEFFENAISFKDTQVRITKIIVDEDENRKIKIPTNDILDCMRSNNILDPALTNFSNQLLNFLDKHLFGNNENLYKIKYVDSSDYVALNTENTELGDSPKIVDKIDLLYKNLEETVKFLKYFNLNHVEQIGKSLQKPIADKVISGYLKKSIPEKGVMLKNYGKVIDLTNTFEDSMRSKGIFDSSFKELSKFVDEYDLKFAEQKSKLALETARDLILKNDDSTIEFEIESPTYEFSGLKGSKENSISIFSFPKCQISKRTDELITYIRNILNEGAETSQRSMEILFDCCCNILELFLAMVPILHEVNIEYVPTIAATFHNDCMFIAHSLLTLGVEFRHGNNLMRQHMMFTQKISSFRELGERIYSDQMKIHKELILESFAFANGLHGTENQDRFTKVEQAFKKIVFRIQSLEKAWKGLFPTKVYCMAMGLLIGTVIDKIIEKTFLLKDIGATESTQLNALFKNLWILDTIFPPKDIEKYVQNWTKFKEITMIFDTSLVDITDKWNSKKLPMFTQSEIIFFIKALFNDTDKRRQKLRELM